MAMGGQSPLGIIKPLALFGFGAIAFALWKQQLGLKNYGHDIYPIETDNVDSETFKDDLKKLQDMDKDYTLRLINNGENAPTVDPVDPLDPSSPLNPLAAKGVKPPAIITHTNPAGEKVVHAYINKPGSGFSLVDITDKMAEKPFKSLNFPKVLFPKYDVIENPSVVKKLVSDHEHIHVAKKFTHGDTALDNRIFLVKEKSSGEYFAYIQSKDGEYTKYDLNTTAAQNLLDKIKSEDFNYASLRTKSMTGAEELSLGNVKSVRRSLVADTIEDTLDVAELSFADRIKKIKAEHPKFTPSELEDKLIENSRRTMLYSGLAGSSIIKQAAQSGMSSATYSLMNSVTHGGGSLTKKVQDIKGNVKKSLGI